MVKRVWSVVAVKVAVRLGLEVGARLRGEGEEKGLAWGGERLRSRVRMSAGV